MASRTVSDSDRICITYLFPLTVHRCASVRLALPVLHTGRTGQCGNAVSGNAPSGNASPGNALCQRMEIPRARIVSQPIPSLTHRARPRPRQTLEIRKPLEKPRIVLRHAAHLCLLQHELGHEHAVRIARLAPWQVARGAGPPGEELARKYLCARGLAHAGGRRTGHGYPRYSP